MAAAPTFPPDLDHVVYAGPDLVAAIDRFEELTGVRAAPGGAHPTGTANALIAFTVDGERTPRYLEIIGPDPARGMRARDIPQYGIRDRIGPGITGFVIHPRDFDATVARATEAGVQTGAVAPLSRTRPDGTLLEWRRTGWTGDRDPDPAVPILIDWGATPHPGLGELPTVELVALRVTHSDADGLREKYDVLDVGIPITAGPRTGLTLVVAGAGRTVELH